MRRNNLEPLSARRRHLELYLLWMQEARGLVARQNGKSTVKRTVSLVVTVTAFGARPGYAAA